MSRHKVSRGNTSDLIGMFNKKSQIEAPSSGDVGGLLSVNPGSLGVSHKFRKTSAFVPSTTKIEDKVKGQGLCFLIDIKIQTPQFTFLPLYWLNIYVDAECKIIIIDFEQVSTYSRYSFINSRIFCS